MFESLAFFSCIRLCVSELTLVHLRLRSKDKGIVLQPGPLGKRTKGACTAWTRRPHVHGDSKELPEKTRKQCKQETADLKGVIHTSHIQQVKPGSPIGTLNTYYGIPYQAHSLTHVLKLSSSA